LGGVVPAAAFPAGAVGSFSGGGGELFSGLGAVFASVIGFVAVVFSLAARDARPGRAILGILILGMSDLPSGMPAS
jgi:hypothetical protein